MQAMDQTNPASSRAIAVTTTWFNLPLATNVTIALTKPGLRFPSDLADCVGHCIDGGQLVASDAGREAIAVSGFDQQGAGVNVAGFGNGADAALRAGGMFRRHQTKIGHEVGC